MRLTYPGITKLVVVKSVYNDTPAGRAAIDVVARYFGGLSSATQRRSIADESRLASKDCTQCQADLKRIQGYIDEGQRVVAANGRPGNFKSVAVFVSQITADGVAVLSFDGVDPTLKLVDSSGKTLGVDTGGVVSSNVYVVTEIGKPLIVNLL